MAAKKARKKKAAPARSSRPSVKAAAPDRQRAIEQFLYRQSELLDDRKWDEFIDLFAKDGRYWMPAAPEQTTGDGVPSIFYEDRNLMMVRARRVGHPRAWSQAPMWGTSHLVSNVAIESENRKTGELVVRSRFHMMEIRRDNTRSFAGIYRHWLVPQGKGDYRIKLQRVDMVNGQAPFDYVLQIWV